MKIKIYIILSLVFLLVVGTSYGTKKYENNVEVINYKGTSPTIYGDEGRVIYFDKVGDINHDKKVDVTDILIIVTLCIVVMLFI